MKCVNGYYKRIKFLSLYPILFSGGTHYKAGDDANDALRMKEDRD
jgi:lysozyme family protein